MASTNNLHLQETNDIKMRCLSFSIEHEYKKLWENAPKDPTFMILY